MTDQKQSQFIEIQELSDSDYVPVFGQSSNRKISKPNLFDQIKDETQIFIYPSTDQLQAADLVADPDWPVYVRNEETEYRLYKITGLAPGVNDISLNNGLTATFQEEYSDIGFVVGPAVSNDGAIALFDGTGGIQLKNGVVPTTIGNAFISTPNSANTGYPKKNADNTLSMQTANQLKVDLDIDQVSNAGFAGKVAGPASATDGFVALFDGITGKLIKLGDSMANYLAAFLVTLYNIFPRKIDTWAAIGSITPIGAGQLFTLAQHTSDGIGSGLLMSFTGSVTDDGGTQKNALGGFYLKRINYPFAIPQFWGVIGNGVADDTAAAQLAINSGFNYLYWPAGAYNINASGLTGASNQTWQGAGIGLTKIIANAVPTLDFIKFSSKTNFFIRGITFDGGGFLTALGGSYPALLPIIYNLQCSYFEIEKCEFVGFRTCAVLSNICHDYKVNGNFVTRTGTDGTIINYGIACPGGVGSENYNGHVCDNTLVRCDIAVNASYMKINNNTISGWAFSSGIDLVVDPSCHDNEVDGNTIHDSVQAPDKDGFFPCGIENWSKNTIITNNTIYGCYGDGIENGGKDCTIDNNQCRNNGSSGLYNLYQDATYNASGTVADGNVFNNNGQYGIREQSALLTDLKYGPSHRLNGNTSGKFNILSPNSEYWDSGTTTLNLVGGTTPGTQPTSKNSWSWNRKGLECTITGRIQLSAISGTGQVRLSNIPFPARNTADLFGTAAIQYSGFNTTWVSIVALVNQGQSYITLTGNTAAATGNSSVNMSDLSATALICFTVTYLV